MNIVKTNLLCYSSLGLAVVDMIALVFKSKGGIFAPGSWKVVLASM